jgi:P27 family predicted phage terminase small subunit
MTTGKKADLASTASPPNKEVSDTPEMLLTCPEHLSPRAKEQWDFLLRELPNVVRLRNIDRTMLAVFCEAYALWFEATEALRKYGPVMKSPSGYPVQSPYVAIANQQAAILEKISAAFGLTPGSRIKLPRVGDEVTEGFSLPDLVL